MIQQIKYLGVPLVMTPINYGVTPSKQFTPSFPFIDNNDIFCPSPSFSGDLPEPWNSCRETLDPFELTWQKYFIENTPNGDLIGDNSLFESYLASKDQILLHITPAYDKIIESGLLYPSGGSLGSSVYCVPLRGDRIPHNLIDFILNYEIPNSHLARKISMKESKILAITVSQESFSNINMEMSGMDHLQLGEIQSKIYDAFIQESNLDKSIQNELEQQISKRAQESIAFLNLCVEYKLNHVTNVEFFSQFSSLLTKNPFFGYVYFEVLVEYVTLHQNDEMTLALKAKGEINNHNHKKMIFEVSSNLLSSFKLIEFNPSIQEFSNYLERKSQQNQIIIDFDNGHFLHFMKWRLAEVVRSKIMRSNVIKNTDFDNLRYEHPSLVGQMIRTEIALSSKLREVAYIYDILRAKEIRNFWTSNNILFPYNAIVPKGEVGINPSYKDLKYKINDVTYDKTSKRVRLGDELNVRLATELINPSLSTLRFQIKALHGREKITCL